MLRLLTITLMLLAIPLPAITQDASQHGIWLDEILESSRRIANEANPDAILGDIDPGPAVFDGVQKKPLIPELLVFVSFTMPDKSLKALLEQTKRAGGTLVVRGLVNNSFKDTQVRVAELVTEDSPGISVDPKLFRLFRVESVPTFVVMQKPLLPCVTADCHEVAPTHDKIAGNMSLPSALQQIARNGETAEVASVYLARFRGESP